MVAAPDGRILINSTGNPGMATGGSGDILEGMTGRFAAGRKRRFHGSDILALSDRRGAGVYLDGRPGDIAVRE